jgi:hypothetical protein
MLRINASDRPVSARYEFAFPEEEGRSVFEVTETDEAPPLVAELPQHPELPQAPSEKPVEPPAADPPDELETRVRLALHKAAADGNVLLAVTNDPPGLKVWGVVPDEATKRRVIERLDGLAAVTVAVVSEQEQGELQARVPWEAFHGDAAPLGYEMVNALFPNNPQGRQQYLNNLDALTRGLAGETKTRDALRRLADRMRSQDYAPALELAIADLDRRIAADLDRVAKELEPLTGPLDPEPAGLTYPEAMELYVAVHQVAFLGRSADRLTLPEALGRVADLIQ